MNKKLYIRLTTQSLLFLVVLGALLFLPAGTFDYWEAWAFLAVFIACNLPITIWVAINDPQLLERRMRAGPTAEKEKSQKIIVTIAFLAFAGELLIPALDHRFGWSDVPTFIVILGNALIVISYIGFYFVFRENTRRRHHPSGRESKGHLDGAVLHSPSSYVRRGAYLDARDSAGARLMVGTPCARARRPGVGVADS